MKKFIIILSLLFLNCQNKTTQKITVGIQPYADFPKDKTDTIAKTIADFYQIQTVVLPMKLPYKEAFVTIKSPRYRANKLIALQRENKPDSLDYILGLLTKDISVTKKDASGQTKKPIYKYEDWGIMGLAYCPGNSCVVSTFRIQHPNQKIHFSRLKKVTVHEFGHNLGLPHCSDKTCVMTDAVESVTTIDNAKLALCGKCKKRLG